MNNKRGFTFVELLMVASILFVVVVGGLVVAMLTGRTFYISADASVQVQQEARRSFDAMVRELRSSGGGQVTVSDNTQTNPTSKQLNFRIARGYNLAACPNAICWGSDVADNEYVHYAIVAAPDDGHWMIRCRDNLAAGEIAAYNAATCRVLATSLRHEVGSPDAFVYNGASEEVTINLQMEDSNPILPTGSVTGPVLTSRVKLRN